MNTEKLFSYGTLQYEDVQMTNFGRLLDGEDDCLPGFQLSMIEITDPEVIAASGEAFHPIITFTGNPKDEVNGIVFDISSEELKQADSYEVSDYKRIEVKLASGVSTWVYVQAAPTVIE